MVFRLIKKTKGIWSDKSFSSLLYSFTILIILGLICSQIIGAFLCKFLFNVSFSLIETSLSSNQNLILESLKCIQLVNAFGVFFIPSILFFHFRGINLIKELGLNISLSSSHIIFLFLLAIFMIPSANFLADLNKGIPLPSSFLFLKEIEAQTLFFTEQLMKMNNYFDLIQMLFIVGFIAALGEELIFRGLLQNLFNEWWGNMHLAIWLTAFLFSIIHLQYQAFFPRFLLGAIIGYVYLHSGSLKSSILLHFIYNSTLVVMTFAIQKSFLDTSWEYIGVGNVIWGILIVFVLLLFFFKKPLVKD